MGIINPDKHLKDPFGSFWDYIKEDFLNWYQEQGIYVAWEDIDVEVKSYDYFSACNTPRNYYGEYSTYEWNTPEEEELNEEGKKYLQSQNGDISWPDVWCAVRLKKTGELLPAEVGAVQEAKENGEIPKKYL